MFECLPACMSAASRVFVVPSFSFPGKKCTISTRDPEAWLSHSLAVLIRPLELEAYEQPHSVGRFSLLPPLGLGLSRPHFLHKPVREISPRIKCTICWLFLWSPPLSTAWEIPAHLSFTSHNLFVTVYFVHDIYAQPSASPRLWRTEGNSGEWISSRQSLQSNCFYYLWHLAGFSALKWYFLSNPLKVFNIKILKSLISHLASSPSFAEVWLVCKLVQSSKSTSRKFTINLGHP